MRSSQAEEVYWKLTLRSLYICWHIPCKHETAELTNCLFTESNHSSGMVGIITSRRSMPVATICYYRRVRKYIQSRVIHTPANGGRSSAASCARAICCSSPFFCSAARLKAIHTIIGRRIRGAAAKNWMAPTVRAFDREPHRYGFLLRRVM